jgi:hypothetical protein
MKSPQASRPQAELGSDSIWRKAEVPASIAEEDQVTSERQSRSSLSASQLLRNRWAEVKRTHKAVNKAVR